jgi:predicted HD phosphohydrolase
MLENSHSLEYYNPIDFFVSTECLFHDIESFGLVAYITKEQDPIPKIIVDPLIPSKYFYLRSIDHQLFGLLLEHRNLLLFEKNKLEKAYEEREKKLHTVGKLFEKHFNKRILNYVRNHLNRKKFHHALKILFFHFQSNYRRYLTQVSLELSSLKFQTSMSIESFICCIIYLHRTRAFLLKDSSIYREDDILKDLIDKLNEANFAKATCNLIHFDRDISLKQALDLLMKEQISSASPPKQLQPQLGLSALVSSLMQSRQENGKVFKRVLKGRKPFESDLISLYITKENKLQSDNNNSQATKQSLSEDIPSHLLLTLNKQPCTADELFDWTLPRKLLLYLNDSLLVFLSSQLHKVDTLGQTSILSNSKRHRSTHKESRQDMPSSKSIEEPTDHSAPVRFQCDIKEEFHKSHEALSGRLDELHHLLQQVIKEQKACSMQLESSMERLLTSVGFQKSVSRSLYSTQPHWPKRDETISLDHR